VKAPSTECIQYCDNVVIQLHIDIWMPFVTYLASEICVVLMIE